MSLPVRRLRILRGLGGQRTIASRLVTAASPVTAEYARLDNLRVRIETHHQYSAIKDDIEGLVLAFTTRTAPTSGVALDVGCGTGEFLQRASNLLPELELHACDTSPEAVAASARIAGVIAQFGDALRLPYSSNSFDVVWLRHVIYHLSNPRLAVHELARVARPGGTVILSTNCAGSLPQITTVIESALLSVGLPAVSTADECDDKTALSLMEESFANIQCERYDNSLEFNHLEPIVRYAVASLGVYGVPPTRAAWKSVVTVLCQNIADKFAANGGRWSDPKSVVLIAGRLIQ